MIIEWLSGAQCKANSKLLKTSWRQFILDNFSWKWLLLQHPYISKSRQAYTGPGSIFRNKMGHTVTTVGKNLQRQNAFSLPRTEVDIEDIVTSSVWSLQILLGLLCFRRGCSWKSTFIGAEAASQWNNSITFETHDSPSSLVLHNVVGSCHYYVLTLQGRTLLCFGPWVACQRTHILQDLKRNLVAFPDPEITKPSLYELMWVKGLRSTCNFCICSRKRVQTTLDIEATLIVQPAGYRKQTLCQRESLYLSFKFVIGRHLQLKQDSEKRP